MFLVIVGSLTEKTLYASPWMQKKILQKYLEITFLNHKMQFKEC